MQILNGLERKKMESDERDSREFQKQPKVVIYVTFSLNCHITNKEDHRV